jgi:hypothetical protein
MPIALKEWSVTVRALAEGEQLLTVRRAPEGGGYLEHERFFLYPTFELQRSDLVRESHRSEMDRALEEGVWAEGEPAAVEVAADGSLPQPDRIRIRAWAEVVEEWTVTDHRLLGALSPFHVWTPGYAEKRLGWRRRDPLQIALLRTHRIPRPVTVRVGAEYPDPNQFAEITRDLPFEGTPVLAEGEFDFAAMAIRDLIERATTHSAVLA